MKCLASLLLFVLTLAAAAPSARADAFIPADTPKESPRWFMFELKLGPYTPNVDSSTNLTQTPYKDVFGDEVKLMTQLTLDIEFLKLHGVLAVGFTWGNFKVSGSALYDTGEASGDTTSLTIMPLVLQLVYRWDYPAQKWGIPVVPYIRAGIVYAIWWIKDGAGDIAHFTPTGSSTEGPKAMGGTWGYQINVGVSFQLDVLEPSAAKAMDMEIGINHSYIFVEYVHNRIDDFKGKRMRLGMEHGLLAGLSLEF